MSSPQDGSQCPICGAQLAAGRSFCANCGLRLDEAPIEEFRSVSYLLSQLKNWEASGLIAASEARALRDRYELRRDELRTQLGTNGARPKPAALPPQPDEASEGGSSLTETPSPTTTSEEQPARTFPAPSVAQPAPLNARPVNAPPARGSLASANPQLASANETRLRAGATPTRAARRRPLFEMLADPYTLRLLLYTGAAMLVVGIVIWLRDVLYLKLQEPLVQAALLALGTIAITVAGWLTTLRTRLRLTGRALTLMGSLLVPVNFWFLVRSGLITDNGRAWLVCALCAALYGGTAALLRERLYVYLSSAATIATAWALVYRATPEAYGLYALMLSVASLFFLHLSRLFPLSPARADEGSTGRTNEAEETVADDVGDDVGNDVGATEIVAEDKASPSRLSYELWGPPLVRVALCGAAAAALLYVLLLRFNSSSSFYDGAFRWRANRYDAGIGMLLFGAVAYVAWFTGRYLYTDRRSLLYTTSVLALFWTEFLLLDGLRLNGSLHLLALASATLLAALAARSTSEDVTGRALHRAGVIASVALALATPGVLLTAGSLTTTQSAAHFVLGLALAVLSTPRFSGRVSQLALAHASAVFFSLAFFAALTTSEQRDEIIFATSAVWPFVLYGGGRLAANMWGERQLAAPLTRVADIECTMLLLAVGVVSLLLHLGASVGVESWRPTVFFVLIATTLYGALRGSSERAVYGAELASAAALVLIATLLDALQQSGVFPSSWPVAGGVICAAFTLQWASARWLEPREKMKAENESPRSPAQSVRPPVLGRSSLDATVRLFMDGAVLICALLWFARTLVLTSNRWSAACVMLLALLYWLERAASRRLALSVYMASVHAGAFLLTLLTAINLEGRWLACVFTLLLFPLFFVISRMARARGANWLAQATAQAAAVLAGLIAGAVTVQAAPFLETGNELLLAPAVTAGALCAVTLAASLFSAGLVRVRYFRVGLGAAVAAFVLLALRAGYDPVADVEMYTSPIAVLLLIVSYAAARREWDEYARDANLLLWAGSLLLCGPLLIRALQFRLLLDLPAVWRDLGVLCASFLLVLFGVLGRLRAPTIAGTITLLVELVALALTSVHWLQVPLRNYLITGGVLIIIVWGIFEYRREQILSMRQRLHERGAQARERFGEWR